MKTKSNFDNNNNKEKQKTTLIFIGAYTYCSITQNIIELNSIMTFKCLQMNDIKIYGQWKTRPIDLNCARAHHTKPHTIKSNFGLMCQYNVTMY